MTKATVYVALDGEVLQLTQDCICVYPLSILQTKEQYWIVAHLQSMTALTTCDTPEQAHAIAQALVPLADQIGKVVDTPSPYKKDLLSTIDGIVLQIKAGN